MFAVAAAAQPTPDAQLAAMKKLDYMVGDWRGEGWIEMGGRRFAFTGGEVVQRKLNGVALLVEGSFFGNRPDGTTIPVHTTLGVITYDFKSEKYRFASWLATGTSGERELELTADGWRWEIRSPSSVVRYVFRLSEKGEWIETGERSTDGTTWKQFFEMRLKKNG